MNLLVEILVSVLIVLGAVFALVGSWGLVRLPHLIARLHAPTKATTLGVGGVLLASMVYFFAIGDSPSIHELLIVLFLFLTAPISASFVAKAYLRGHVDPAILPAGGERGWITYAPVPGAEPASAEPAHDDPPQR